MYAPFIFTLYKTVTQEIRHKCKTSLQNQKKTVKTLYKAKQRLYSPFNNSIIAGFEMSFVDVHPLADGIRHGETGYFVCLDPVDLS